MNTQRTKQKYETIKYITFDCSRDRKHASTGSNVLKVKKNVRPKLMLDWLMVRCLIIIELTHNHGLS